MSLREQSTRALPRSRTSRLHASRRRALLATLFAALLLHLVALVVGRHEADAQQDTPQQLTLLEPADVELLPELPATPPGHDSSGGGSVERALAPRAAGAEAKAEPKPTRVHAVPLTKPVDVPPSPPVAATKDQPENGSSEVQPDEDLFALDALLTQPEGEQVAPSQVRPRPAWRAVTSTDTALAAMAGKQATAARNFGSGPGRHGGTGGEGRHGTGGEKENTPFGGSQGAFRGQVCAIAPGTPSIRSLGACQPIRELYTDTFNIPTRAFDLGFPGLPGQNEWFAILYTGRFVVKTSGLHLFRLASDDGSILQIDGEVVIDNDGTHGPVSRRGTIELAAGPHELRLRYFQGPRNLVALQLFVTPPEKGERLFRASF